MLSLPLDDFLFRRLPEILSLSRGEVFWHYNPLCHGCPFSQGCEKKAIEKGKLGSMSNISIGEAKSLRSLLLLRQSSETTAPHEVTDIEDLASLLEDRDGMRKISKSYPVTLRKAQRILALPFRTRNSIKSILPHSPVLQAARTRQIQVQGPEHSFRILAHSFLTDNTSPELYMPKD